MKLSRPWKLAMAGFAIVLVDLLLAFVVLSQKGRRDLEERLDALRAAGYPTSLPELNYSKGWAACHFSFAATGAVISN